MHQEHIPMIVLTGGPCGGKTNGLSYLQQKLADIGFTVVTVSEAATDLILSGIKPGPLVGVEFQLQVLRESIEKEDRRKDAAQKMRGKKKVIICDRGVADIAAYVTPDEVAKILREHGSTPVDLRDRRYDAVIFLRSVAFDRPEIYTKLNNAARSEPVEQARLVDERTLAAWTGHPHLRVIDNSTDLEGKCHRVFQAVCRVLGIPAPVEIERKYRLDGFDPSILPKDTQAIEIVQHYLSNEMVNEERVRMRGQNGSFVYYHTVKWWLNATTRKEIERQITREEYLEFIKRADPNRFPIKKTRYCFVWKNQYFELDVFKSTAPTLLKDVVVLEVELTEENSTVELPEFLAGIAEDVTGQREFSNYALAERR